MATPPRNPSPERTGIFSSVFDFVSREFECFVANATGRADEQQAPPQHKAHNKLRKEPGRFRKTRHDSPNARNAAKKVERAKQAARERDRANAGETSRKRAETRPQEGEQDQPATSSFNMPPPPVPAASSSRPTMPGSLFPRSPSMMPETPRPILQFTPATPIRETAVEEHLPTPTRSPPKRAR
ncbi:hypothetical protein EV715DRAFT_164765, partial [Schizophyllum commune]